MKELLENQEYCKDCGECCKKSGCDYTPNDFSSLNKEQLYQVLQEGNISIVSLLQFDQLKDGRLVVSPFLYLRARNQDRPIVDLVSLKTPCSQLKEDGCRYDFSHRPSGGKNLVPAANHIDCHPYIELGVLMQDWHRYQKVLEKLVKRFTGLSVEAKLKEDIEGLFCDIYNENFEHVHARELIDVEQMLPYLIQACPEEYKKASAKFSSEPVALKVKGKKCHKS